MVRKTARAVFGFVLIAAVVGAAAWAYLQTQSRPEPVEAAPASASKPLLPGQVATVRLSRQARENLRLEAKPLQLTTHWHTVDLPGVIVGRPGVSEHDVAAPISGIVTDIAHFPGDILKPGVPLFSVRLLSESLHTSQMELFKATQEIVIERSQLARLSEAAESGAIPGSRTIAIENEIKRLGAAVEAYRQDLKARGLSTEEIESVAQGKFVTQIIVRAPRMVQKQPAGVAHASTQTLEEPQDFELQSLKVSLGQQVDAGQLLAELADHRALFVEARAFKDDLPLVQRAAKRGWEVEVDFELPADSEWPPLPTRLPIDHVGNIVDAATNTFAFYLCLENQFQTYTGPGGTTRRLWRFRPGGRVRLRVPVEELENVFVVPRAAIAQEGPEAFLFRRNGDLFDRRPVRVLLEDRTHAVVAHDGSVSPGFFVVQNAAASLNRILKAQNASGMPANFHIHADGTIHEAH